MTPEKPRFPLSAVQERDLDLLLAEELVCNPSFGRWFLGALGDERLADAEIHEVRHSVGHPILGESDLEVTVTTAAGDRVLLLIEDKLDAPFQPDQPDRYLARACEYVGAGSAAWCLTVLVAPQRYLVGRGANAPFAATVAVEAIRDHFAGIEDSRSQYRARLLAMAATVRTTYEVQPDARTTDFYGRYWHLAKASMPDLRPFAPGPRGTGATWISLFSPSLPRGVELIHKTNQQRVDLQLARRAADVAELQERCADSLDGDMRIEAAGKSAVVRIDVPLVDTKGDFVAQRAQIDAGIEAAARLLQWYRHHAARLRVSE